MKEKILSLFLQSPDSFLSGEEISEKLGVTRAAVWKHLNTLRAEGFVFESAPRLGYRLIAVPDILYPLLVQKELATRCFGRNIVHFAETASTNITAKELAADGAKEGTLVLAETQTKGKGRLGREWSSPAGVGLWLSLILRPPILPPATPQITLLTAVALAEEVKKLGIPAGIKWPNDLLVSGKKLAGILTEMGAETDRVNYVVVGVGINVNTAEFPPEIADIATSLRLEAGKHIERRRLLQNFLVNWERWYDRWLAEGFAPVREAWLRESVTVGQEVKVTSITGVTAGTAVGLDSDGALLLQTPDGAVRRILSGDVTLKES